MIHSFNLEVLHNPTLFPKKFLLIANQNSPDLKDVVENFEEMASDIGKRTRKLFGEFCENWSDHKIFPD